MKINNAIGNRNDLPLPFFRRINIEIGLNWAMPGRLAISKWIFDPYLGLTHPGKRVTRTDMPDGLGAWFMDENHRALYYWLRGAIRILGFDFGFSVFYRLKRANKRDCEAAARAAHPAT